MNNIWRVIAVSVLVFSLPATTASAAVDQPYTWERRYNSGWNLAERDPAIAVDKYNNVVVVGASEAGAAMIEDFFIVKYNSAGRKLWAKRLNTGVDDFAEYVKVDSSCNIYVTGKSYTNGRNKYDIVTVKYNSAGRKLWLARYNGVGIGSDYPYGIAVDKYGGVYVLGTSCVSRPGALSVNDDIVTLRYSSTGRLKWARRLYASSVKNDGAVRNGIGVDRNANVFVTGFGVNTADHADWLVAKYNSSGTRLWKRSYDGPVHGTDMPKGLKVDRAGAVCVTGRTPENSNPYPPSDIVTAKWSATGSRKWVNTLGGYPGYTDEPLALAIGPSNSVVVCGYTSPQSSYTDLLLVKYDTNGVEKWNATVNSTGQSPSEDVGSDVVVDGLGNVFTTGYSTADGMDFMTVKHDANGNFLWYAFYNGPGDNYDWKTRIALGTNCVYVTGESYGGSQTGYDFATLKYAK